MNEKKTPRAAALLPIAVFLELYLALVLILMYLPIAVVVLYSFNANTSRYPNEFTGFSLQFY